MKLFFISLFIVYMGIKEGGKAAMTPLKYHFFHAQQQTISKDTNEISNDTGEISLREG